MTRNGSLNRNESVGLQPLLGPVKDLAPQRSQKGKNSCLLVVLCAGVAMLLVEHILFVALLRKATVTLDKLTVPDVCHQRSVGEIIVKFQNPSYCSPMVGPLIVTLTKQKTSFLSVQIPAFELQSGITTMKSQIKFELLTDPNVFYKLVLANDDDIDVHGEIPVLISCMLVSFTIHLDVSNLLGTKPSKLASVFNSLAWQFSLTPTVYGVDTWRPNRIKTELQYVVTQVLQTIMLSHFQTYTDDQGIFAFSEVSFKYDSRVLWNIPSFSLKIKSADKQTIFVTWLKQFRLGSGPTIISAYTEVFKNQSDLLQAMLQAYLAGNDLILFVRGDNGDTDCYSLHVLDLIDIKVAVPAKVDGKPALLREYSIRPSLKELDSKMHKCLLEIELFITINNPLPIQLDLYGIELDLLYSKETMQSRLSLKFLAHVSNIEHVSWSSHVESNVVLEMTVHNFDICMEVVELYLHDLLVLNIQHGHIYMGAASENFSVPFSARDVHIHHVKSSTQELVEE